VPDVVAAGENQNVLLPAFAKHPAFRSVCHLCLPEMRLSRHKIHSGTTHNYG
jgi:hypothetical protein